MPMIRLTVPTGALTNQGRMTDPARSRRCTAAVGGRARHRFLPGRAWSYLTELSEGAQKTAEDDAPRFLVEVTVPQGALSERRKAGLVEEATVTVLAAADLSPDQALRVWVLVHEQPEGTWGAGGSVVRYSDLVALAKGQRADA